jgi:pyridoxine 5-phosphate synthase
LKRLGINIDAVVKLRAFGSGKTPDPIHAIAMIEMAGADSIVYTLQESGSIAEMRDLKILKECIHSHFNLRVTPTSEMVMSALAAKPEMVTFIQQNGPDIRSVNILPIENQLAPLVGTLRAAGVVVNVLIDTDANQIKAALRVGCDYVELHAAKFVSSESITLMEQELENIKSLAMGAAKLNLGVTVSGRLTYTNVRDLLAIGEIEEINVGHAVVARALFVGFDQAVRDFAALIK